MFKGTNSKVMGRVMFIMLSLMLSSVVYSNAYTTNIPTKGKTASKNKGENAWVKENKKYINSVKPNQIGAERVNIERVKRNLPTIAPEKIASDMGNVDAVNGEVNASGAIGGRCRGDLDGRCRGDLDGRCRAGVEAGLYDGETISVMPSYVDNSTLKYFPPLADQGGTASCSAFSGVYYVFTHMNALARGFDVKGTGTTNIFSPKFSYNLINKGTDAGIDDLAWFYSQISKNGTLPWSKLPFEAKNYSLDTTGSSYNAKVWPTDSNLWLEALKNRPSSFGRIDPSTDAGINEMKLLLNNGYVLQADFYWGNNVLPTYDGGIQGIAIKNNPNSTADDTQVGKIARVSLNNPNTSSGHAVTIVGYCDDIWTDINNNNVIDTGELGAFLKVDSYLKPDGTSYGYPISQKEWFSYDYLRKTSKVSGIPSQYTTNRAAGLNSVWWMTVDKDYTVDFVSRITVNTNRRDAIQARLAYTDIISLQRKDTVLLAYDGDIDFMGVFGGEIPLPTTNVTNGTTYGDVTFYLDFTHILNKNALRGRYYDKAYITEFSTWNKSLPLAIKSVSYIDLKYGKTINASPDPHANNVTAFPYTMPAGNILWGWGGYNYPGVRVDLPGPVYGPNASAQTGDITTSTLANYSLITSNGAVPKNAFDQINSSIFSHIGVGGPDYVWLMYNYKLAKKNSKYSITSGTNREYDPSYWSVSSSKDGKHWIEQDRQKNQVFTANNQKKYYKIKYPDNYSYYRMCELSRNTNVQDVKDGKIFDGKPIQIAGIDFIQTP